MMSISLLTSAWKVNESAVGGGGGGAVLALRSSAGGMTVMPPGRASATSTEADTKAAKDTAANARRAWHGSRRNTIFLD